VRTHAAMVLLSLVSMLIGDFVQVIGEGLSLVFGKKILLGDLLVTNVSHLS
jgi:hypothetical protein